MRRGGPDRCHLTTSEIWLDATDSGLEDEEEEDEEDEEKEFPSETRFLLRLGMLLSLAGGRKGALGLGAEPLWRRLLFSGFKPPFSAFKAPEAPGP